MRKNVLIVFALLLITCRFGVCANSTESSLQQDQLLDKEIHTEKNQLLSFGLMKQDNADWLLKDHVAEISGDTIKIFIPYLVHFSLKPQFSVNKKAKVYANGSELVSGNTIVDFSNPVQITVTAKRKSHTYTALVYNSGLPIIYIDTKNSQSIVSKTKWLDSTKMIVYKPNGEVDYDAGTPMVQIKGRGNSTWMSKAKKPYALKLNVSSKILKMPGNKHWCLLANRFDETFFKNDFAFYLGHNFTNLEWTPHGQHVELVLNGNHLGNYYICEQVRIGKNRVQGKYLVEIEQKENAANCDIVTMLGCKLNIVDIDRKNGNETNDDDISSVKKIVNDFESGLMNVGNDTSKYKDYIDVESFADWYLIKEISKDFDGGFQTSSFFHIDYNGKIKMGPIWDFDNSFDYKIRNDKSRNPNFKRDEYKGYNVSKAIWYSYLLKDPDFVNIILKKLDKMIGDSSSICNYIDINAEKLSLSAMGNDLIYNRQQDSVDYNIAQSSNENYRNGMNGIKTFFFKRLMWMRGDLKEKPEEIKLNKMFDYKINSRRKERR